MSRALVPSMIVAALAACGTRPPAEDAARDSTARAAASAPSPATSPTDGSARDDARSAADGALAVLRDYYAAIDARDFARAYAAWGDDGPPGRPTLATFAAGYARTDSVRLSAGPPGRVEGAAGSRYVAIPVTVRAFERGGRETTYTGSYTLRRSVVPGASAASARWHLYRAELGARAAP
jgi:hypothetical protein